MGRTENIDNGSSNEEKVALFRELFFGRQDVYARRFENAKSGRSGYSPECANKWNRGVCGLPHVKCGQCGNRQFAPITDEVVRAHLRGRHPVQLGQPRVIPSKCELRYCENELLSETAKNAIILAFSS